MKHFVLGDEQAVTDHQEANLAFAQMLAFEEREQQAQRIESIGKRLRALRQRAGFTLADVASRAGISVSYLSDMERERTIPALDTLEAIAEVYGLTVGEALVNVRVRPESGE